MWVGTGGKDGGSVNEKAVFGGFGVVATKVARRQVERSGEYVCSGQAAVGAECVSGCNVGARPECLVGLALRLATARRGQTED